MMSCFQIFLSISTCATTAGAHRGDVPQHRARLLRRARGGAVQLDPIKHTLKAPGTERLKLKYDEPLSKVTFKFNLRRYNVGPAADGDDPAQDSDGEDVSVEGVVSQLLELVMTLVEHPRLGGILTPGLGDMVYQTLGQGLTLAHFRAQLEDLRERIAHVRAQFEHPRDTSAG
jgi:hypothetical protein